MRVDSFHYPLPESSIAQEAVEPRDTSRLLDTRDMTDHRFLDLPGLLRPGDLVVVNETRVRAARLVGHKAGTGGAVELLLLDDREDGLWDGLARPARRLRPGVRLEFDHLTAEIVEGPADGAVVVSLQADDVEAAIEAAGEMPLPPYFTGRLEDPDRYQTMFADLPGSAAAPTAGLHFTPRIVSRLEELGIGMATVDLHVGIDTFRPIKADRIGDHQMHSEWCSVPEDTARAVEETRRSGGRVVAIGTTVVRSLESRGSPDGLVEPGQGETDLFLAPGSKFHIVDALVTNFHVPGSTLVVLVAAFMGERWREVYEEALARGYRFLSFGDAMLAEQPGT